MPGGGNSNGPHPPSSRYDAPLEERSGPYGGNVASGGPIAPRRGSGVDRKLSRASAESSRADDDGDTEGDDDNIVPGAVTARLKTYIKPRTPSTREVLDRRARKNAQSRARAAKLRLRIAEIEMKPEDERTEEEIHLWQQYESRRQRKNDRSRERALEKKEEIDRILAKPDKKRTKIERQFLETALSAKKRKNEGDRLRRQRLKELGLATKGTGIKPGISARGPLPPQYQGMVNPPPHHHPMYGQMGGMGGHPHHPMGDIPMSPLPSMPHHQHHQYAPMQSPHFGSPTMMTHPHHQPYGYPSPQRRGPHGTTSRHEGGMPYMPPAQGYDASPPSRHPPPVQQRRNPDGSMSISIGGRSGQQQGGPPFGGEVRGDDISNMMMDNDSRGGYDRSGPRDIKDE